MVPHYNYFILDQRPKHQNTTVDNQNIISTVQSFQHKCSSYVRSQWVPKMTDIKVWDVKVTTDVHMKLGNAGTSIENASER